MAGFQGIHWVAPTTMVASFSLGVLLALGHHLFYRSLAGKPALTSETDMLGFSVSEQQINLAVGTTFALLSKTGFLVAISIAYAQGFWHVAIRNPKQMTLAHLDSMFYALDDLLGFLFAGSWFRHPILLVMVAVAWLLPIASIITPAMLSVEIAPALPPPTSIEHVPNLNFMSLNYMAPMIYYYSTTQTIGRHRQFIDWYYSGPHPEVQRVAAAVASGGDVLPITPPEVNTTWQIHFHGPSITCDPPSSEERRRFQCLFISDAINLYSYASWTEISQSKSTNGIQTLKQNRLRLKYNDFEGITTDNHSTTFYMAVSPQRAVYVQDDNAHHTLAIMHECDDYVDRSVDLSASTAQLLDTKYGSFLKCQLYNASYEVAFDYTKGTQGIRSKVVPHTRFPSDGFHLNTEAMRPMKDPDSHDSLENHRLGSHHWTKNLFRVAEFSYLAAYDAFRDLVSGVVYDNPQGNSGKSGIMRTVLARNLELQQLFQPDAEDSLQSVLHSSDDPNIPPIESRNPYLSSQPWAQAIEELFQNMTISLMSSDFLRANPSTEFAPPPSEVTHHRYHAVYTYASAKLWLAYGLEVVFTLLVACIGGWFFYSNDASFSKNFSTIFRSAQHVILNTDIQECDMVGTDPLPRYLAQASIALPSLKSRQEAMPLKQDEAT